jgi:hypothetical protein
MTPRMWIIAVFSFTALLVIQLADRNRNPEPRDSVAQVQFQ